MVLAPSMATMPRTTYDQAVQFLAEQDPEAVLRQFGAVSADMPARITETREVRLPARLPDLLYEIGSGDDTWIAHVEFQTRDDPQMDQRMVEYMLLAWWSFHLPIQSVLVVLTARGRTRPSPREVVRPARGLHLVGRYDVVRLWEVPAAQILAAGCPSLLPFVPLMAGTKADAAAALRQLRAVPDLDLRRELVVRFVLLGSLRYDSMELLKLVEERSMLTLDDLRESSFHQLIVEEGREKGREAGRHEGEVALLRRLLERRFGPLPPWAIERITNADRPTVEAWGDRVIDAVEISLEDFLT